MNQSRMHLNYFGLREQPFAPTADPAYFYATRDHKSCLFRLWNGIEGRHGISVILGNYGTGKTTLLRKLMRGMADDPEQFNTVVLASPIPSWTSFSLLEAITGHFGLQPVERTFGAHMEALSQYLLANRHRITTLIIDDAQNLNKRGQLELLRLVQNLETPQHKLLNLIFFAQLEWLNILKAAPNFHQRVNISYVLSAMSIEDVTELIQYRLGQAGSQLGRGPRFRTEAIEMIHAFSEGNPRLIVTLCRNALVLAAQIKTTDINPDIIVHTIEKTTAPDAEKLARIKAMMPARASGPVVQPLIAVGEGMSVLPLGSTPRGHVFDKRANQLLLQAAKTRQG